MKLTEFSKNSFTFARALPIFTLVVASACGTVGGENGNSDLPPSGTFLVPTPAESRTGSSSSQAVCSTGTSSYERVEEVIDAENAALEGERALLEELATASPIDEAGVAVYEVESDGRTLRLEAAQDGGQIALVGEITDDEGTFEFINGAMDEGQGQGALVISPRGEEPLTVAWSTSAGDLQFTRTSGDSVTAYSESDERVEFVSDDTIITWDKSDFSGILIDGSGALPACFEGGPELDDFCDIQCSPDDIANIDF